MADLLQDNLALGERLDKHGTRLYNLDKLDIPHKEEARKKQRKRRDAPRSPLGSPPLQPPPPAGVSGTLGAQELSPSDDLIHDDSAPDEQVQVSDDQDSMNDHTPVAAASRKD
ncbi:hypothetical protein Tco_1187203 [Tanacetum coccineum]